MTEVLSDLLRWAVHDVIFFSGDVQTTTIAVAITSSLCCSIVVAVVHIITLIRPAVAQREKPKRRYFMSDSKTSYGAKKFYSRVWWSHGKIQVLCVRCGHFFADEGCRFVTCKSCCFSVLSCHIHQTKSLCSTPCYGGQTELDLSSVRMQACPNRLGYVGAQLTCLNLSDNELEVLPPEIGFLHGLQILTLERNKLSSLPETIGFLAALQCIDISFNMFESVPGCIWNLVCLKQLQMTHNKISDIPPDISRLKNLLMLEISFNNVKNLCKELLHSFQLKVLHASGNSLEKLSEEVGHLVNLEVLDLSSCTITNIPATITNCSKLHTLSVPCNRLQSLPPDLGYLPNLAKLNVMNNSLQYLPHSLIALQDSLTLTVKGNPLISKERYHKFVRTMSDTESFPSLREITAREITRRHIPKIDTLPVVLQDFLKSAGSCSQCRKPVFEFFNSEIVPANFYLCDMEVPLYKLSCSLHTGTSDNVQ